MKRLYSISLLAFTAIVLSCVLFCSSCSVSSVSMEVLRPADVNVPPHIKKVVIINRSLPDKQSTWMNILEGFVTGESIKADKEGSMNCINGLGNKLNQGPRFKAIVSNSTSYKGTGTKTFANPLSWDQINSLCEQYGADAVIALEAFDSDVLFKNAAELVKQTINGKDTMINEFVADLRFRVNSGWRIYDNTSKKIIEENSYMDEKFWTARGATPMAALQSLPNKRDAINASGYFSGEMFAYRISPSWVWINREYYVKKGVPMKTAKQNVKFGNWDKAMEIWKNLTTMAPDKKTKGRAAYNLAVAYEVKGDLKTALEWAKKASQEYHNKRALYLIPDLQQRINDQNRLNNQLNN